MHEEISELVTSREDFRVIRRLVAAQGYLELGMPAHAMRELSTIDDPRAFKGIQCYLHGEALKDQELYEEAIGPLKEAAELFPVPASREVWLSLSECFAECGLGELAELTESVADAVKELADRTLQVAVAPLTLLRESGMPSDLWGQWRGSQAWGTPKEL